MTEYDAGLLNDWGGGNVGWWHDYLRYELARANDHWIEQTEQLRAELAEAQTVKESLIVALDLFGRHSPKGKPCPVCEAIDAAMAGGSAPESAATATRLWGGDAHEM